MKTKMQTPDRVRGDVFERGFTFVELLVVITIIAVLTAAAAASYSSTNKKSRDTKRKSDLQEIRSALEIVRTECSAYPTTALYTTGVVCDSTVYITAEKMPHDPKSGANYTYTPAVDGATYSLCANEMEDPDETKCVTNP